jgi:competence protein ComEC
MSSPEQHLAAGASRPLPVRRGAVLLLLCSLAAGGLTAGSLDCAPSPGPVLVLLALALVPWLHRPSLERAVPALVIALFLHGNQHVSSLLSHDAGAGDIRRRAGERLTVEGDVADRPDRGRLLLDVRAAGAGGELQRTTGLLLVHGWEDASRVQRGDRVRLVGRVRIPQPLGLPGEFDYGRHLALQGVGATLFLSPTERPVVVAAAGSGGLRRWIDRLAAAGGRIIDDAVAGSEGEILKALLTGERGGIPRATEETYSRAGVSHLLSISGFHVGVLALVVFQLLLLACRSERLLLSVNVRRLIPLVTLPVIVFYLVLSGGAIATVRSVIMAAVCTLVLLVDREMDPLHSLFLAALLILAAAPQSIYDISFQLSFLALWGIMLTAPLLEGSVSRIPSPPLRWLAALFIASAAATLATFAAVGWHFNRESLAGLITNLAAVPLVGYGGVAVGFAGLLLSPLIPPLGGVLLQAAALLVRLAGFFIERAAAIPPLRWTAEWYDVLLTVAVLAVLSLGLALRWRLLLFTCLLAVWGGVAVVMGSASDGALAVHFLAVGQGDASLITTPSGETMLVDGGGQSGERGYRFGRRSLVPALERLGVRRIDRLVLSHAHPDHMGGLSAVVEQFPVAEFWFPAGSVDPPELLSLKGQVTEQGGVLRPLSSISPGAVLGGCGIRVLAPLAAPSGDRNEDSLVFRLSWQGWHLLFAGDIGADTESRLLASGQPLAAQVLKVPHHGSRHSSSAPFLAAVSPKEAVISARLGNIYGLPAAEAIQRLQRQGARVHRTDLDGTVTVVCRPGGMEVQEYGRGAGHFPIDTP